MTIDNIDELYSSLKKFKEMEKDIIEYLTKYIKNKSIPVDERWELFKQNSERFPIHTWILHFEELEKNDIEYYDTFGYERYTTVDICDMIESLDDDFNSDDDDIDFNKLKEEILQRGYSRFVLDW